MTNSNTLSGIMARSFAVSILIVTFIIAISLQLSSLAPVNPEPMQYRVEFVQYQPLPTPTRVPAPLNPEPAAYMFHGGTGLVESQAKRGASYVTEWLNVTGIRPYLANSDNFRDERSLGESMIASLGGHETVYIYITGHGNNVGVCIPCLTEGEVGLSGLSYERLDYVLDTLEALGTKRILVVIDSCESGSAMNYLAAPGRTIISSSLPGEKAFYFENGDSFTKFWAECMILGKDERSCTDLAARKLTNGQRPMFYGG